MVRQRYSRGSLRGGWERLCRCADGTLMEHSVLLLIDTDRWRRYFSFGFPMKSLGLAVNGAYILGLCTLVGWDRACCRMCNLSHFVPTRTSELKRSIVYVAPATLSGSMEAQGFELAS
jgi:hypothetical protein